MSDIRSKIAEIYSLEQLSGGHSLIHDRHPLVKLLATLVYLVCVISFDRHAVLVLMPFVFYPVVVLALAGIPYSIVFRRTAVALPFSMFAGLSNLIFDRTIIASVGGLAVSAGLVSFLGIMLRTLLCVTAVLILVAVTPLAALTAQLRRLRVPGLLVALLEMTYRFIGTLAGEASSMFTAYQLRHRSQKGLDPGHMGSFVGLLLIRSFDRAERIYQAMKCRGYPVREEQAAARRLKIADYGFLAMIVCLSLLFRLVDVQGLVTHWLEEVL